MPPDRVLAGRLLDEELVFRGAARVLARFGGQGARGDDRRLVAPDGFLIESRGAQVAAADTDLTLRDHGLTLLRDTRSTGARAAPLLTADIVDEDVLAQPVRRHEERPALVDARHLVDELGQVRPPLEHERVDHDAV